MKYHTLECNRGNSVSVCDCNELLNNSIKWPFKFELLTRLDCNHLLRVTSVPTNNKIENKIKPKDMHSDLSHSEEALLERTVILANGYIRSKDSDKSTSALRLLVLIRALSSLHRLPEFDRCDLEIMKRSLETVSRSASLDDWIKQNTLQSPTKNNVSHFNETSEYTSFYPSTNHTLNLSPIKRKDNTLHSILFENTQNHSNNHDITNHHSTQVTFYEPQYDTNTLLRRCLFNWLR